MNEKDLTNAMPITDWENEPTVRELKQDFLMAKSLHDEWTTKVSDWKDMFHIRGKYKPRDIPNRSKVQPQLVRKQAEWRIPALSEPFLGAEKLFSISPASAGDRRSAEQHEILVNAQIRTRMNRVNFIDEYVRRNVIEGSAIIKGGWKREMGTRMVEKPTFSFLPIQDPNEAMVIQQALALAEQDPEGFEADAPPEIVESVRYFQETGQLVMAVPAGSEEVEEEYVKLNHPTAELINIENIYVDPTCGSDFSKANFIIHSFDTSKAELLKEPDRYHNLDAVQWETAGPLGDADHKSGIEKGLNYKDVLRKKVVAYEYWGYYDVHGDDTLTPIVATWVGDVLIRLEENPFPGQRLPFILSKYLPVVDQLYGEPDAVLLEQNQAILGAVTRGMIDLMARSANSQQGFSRDFLDPYNRKRFERGEDYEFNANSNPATGYHMHTYPEIPQSAMAMVMMQNQEAESITGTKAFTEGISGSTYGQVAAGIRGALDASMTRTMSILRRLAYGLKEMGYMFCNMNGAFLSANEIVRLTDDEFVEIMPEDLNGEFDLEVDIASQEVDDMKAQDLGFVLQTIGPNSPPGMTQRVMAEMVRLKRMPDFAKELRDFQPQPDPQEQELRQLEIEKLKMEVAKLKAETGLKEAQTSKTLEEADALNLDTAETEAGTKHERELAKQKAQARGNRDLEMTKALLKSRKAGESDPDIDAAVGFNAMNDAKDAPPISPTPPPVAQPIPPADPLAPQGAPQGLPPQPLNSNQGF